VQSDNGGLQLVGGREWAETSVSTSSTTCAEGRTGPDEPDAQQAVAFGQVLWTSFGPKQTGMVSTWLHGQMATDSEGIWHPAQAHSKAER
jgi:hypothetical protein